MGIFFIANGKKIENSNKKSEYFKEFNLQFKDNNLIRVLLVFYFMYVCVGMNVCVCVSATHH